MSRLLLACALVASALAGDPHPHDRPMNDCGNSNYCPADMTCATTPDNIVVPARDHHFIKVDHHHHRQTNIVIGNKFGCAPTKKATLCQDVRFSCPSGFYCAVDGKTKKANHCERKLDEDSEQATKPKTVPLLHNVNSKRIPHHMAKHFPLSFPHLAKTNNLVKVASSKTMVSRAAAPHWVTAGQCGCYCDGCTQTQEGACDCGGCNCDQGGCQSCQCCTYASDDDYPVDDDWGGYDDDTGGPASFCAEIRSSLPSECSCTDVSGGSNVNCALSMGGTSVGAAVKITPCGTPACMGLDILLFGYQYPVTGMCMGETGRLPVPGAAIDIGIGGAGIYATYTINGNPSRISISFGIDACVASFLGDVCVYGGSGYEIIEASVGLTDICDLTDEPHGHFRKISNTTADTVALRPLLRAPAAAAAAAA